MRSKIIFFCDHAIEWCLYFLVFCLPFSKAGVSIFIVLGIVAWAVKRIAGFRIDGPMGLISSTSLNRALAIFVFINLASVLLSADIMFSLEAFFTKIIKFSMIFLMVVETINNEKRCKRLLWFMIFSAILIAADAGVQYFRGVDFLKGYGGERLKASFSAPNGFAGWLIVFIPIFLGVIAGGEKSFFKRKMKIFLIALGMLLFIFLTMTFSRGAWFGFLFGFIIILYFFLKEKKVKLRYKMLSLLALIVLCGVVALIWPSIKNMEICFGESRSKKLETIEQRLSLTTGLESRKNLWTESWLMIKDHPFFGSGLNTYSITAPKYKVSTSGGIYAHNSYLQMAAEIGILGLTSFLWILFSFFKMGFSYLNRKKDYLVLGCIAAISGFLVHAFFDNHLYALQLVVLFWFMLGFTTALIKLQDS